MYKTLDDYKVNKGNNKKNDKKTEMYAGGGKSGMAIENNNDLESIINKAKEQGQQPPQQSINNQGNKVNCKITLYQNGFTIDDGELREYSSEANKEFMQ